MRYFSILMAILCFGLFPEVVSAQTDASVWIRRSQGETVYMPWVITTTSKFIFDARYNYDQKNTAGLFAGINRKISGVSVMPNVGVLVGDYGAVSAQVYTDWRPGKLTLFTMNQYAWKVGSSDFNFFYHWVDAMYRVHPNLLLGVNEQIYWDTNDRESFLDVGPVARFEFGKTYIKVWPTASPYQGQGKKLILVAGFILGG